MGGSDDDERYKIALDASGNAFITGGILIIPIVLSFMKIESPRTDSLTSQLMIYIYDLKSFNS